MTDSLTKLQFQAKIPKIIHSIYRHPLDTFHSRILDKYHVPIRCSMLYKRTLMLFFTIWINAKNAKVACGDQIPEPIKAYMDLLRNCYNIETKHLLK